MGIDGQRTVCIEPVCHLPSDSPGRAARTADGGRGHSAHTSSQAGAAPRCSRSEEVACERVAWLAARWHHPFFGWIGRCECSDSATWLRHLSAQHDGAAEWACETGADAWCARSHFGYGEASLNRHWLVFLPPPHLHARCGAFGYPATRFSVLRHGSRGSRGTQHLGERCQMPEIVRLPCSQNPHVTLRESETHVSGASRL
jgi:hypothetical protein